MSASVQLNESRIEWKEPGPEPLNEAVWEAWVAKGRAREQRSSDARVRAVKLVSLMGLLVTAGFSSDVPGLGLAVRFVVCGGSVALMLLALKSRRYVFAAAFLAVALLYNPVAQIFNFPSGWQLPLALASALPFVGSLVWRNENGRVGNNA